MARVGRAIGGKALLVGTFDGIPGQYSTIQAAVNAAQPGDWILIAPGDYHEQADHDHPPSAEDISLGWYGGVAIHTSDIHLRGMNRNSVIVDGTTPGLTTLQQQSRRSGPRGAEPQRPLGRNGIDIWANNVTRRQSHHLQLPTRREQPGKPGRRRRATRSGGTAATTQGRSA